MARALNYYEMSEGERQAYHRGYKAGLDSCTSSYESGWDEACFEMKNFIERLTVNDE